MSWRGSRWSSISKIDGSVPRILRERVTYFRNDLHGVPWEGVFVYSRIVPTLERGNNTKRYEIIGKYNNRSGLLMGTSKNSEFAQMQGAKKF